MLARAIVAKLFLFLLFAFVAGDAQAQQPAVKAPMRVVIVTGDDPQCDGHCAQWISAEGQITMATPGEFSRALRAMGRDKLPIVIHSPGGAVPAALQIGRMIRRRGLSIVVGQTNFSGCEPHDAKCGGQRGFQGYRGAISSGVAFCASACSFLLAGGVERDVGPRAFVGVHQTTQQFTHVLTRYMVRVLKYPDGHRVVVSREVTGQTRWTDGPQAQTSPVQYKNISAYFKEMGIGTGVLPLILATPNSSIHWMTRSELQDTAMATDDTDARQMMASSAENRLAAYRASVDYRVLTYAHALLSMGEGREGPILLSLDFVYHRNDGVVSLVATPTSNGELIARPPVNVYLAMPKGQFALAPEASRRTLSQPLTTPIRTSEFCELADDGMITVGYESGHLPGQTKLNLPVNAQTFSSMPALIKEVCGRAIPARPKMIARDKEVVRRSPPDVVSHKLYLPDSPEQPNGRDRLW